MGSLNTYPKNNFYSHTARFGGNIMKKKYYLVISILIAAVVLLPVPGNTTGVAIANEDNYIRIDGEIKGYPYSLFRPDAWNGDLVLLVHGAIPGTFEGLAQDLISEGFGVGFFTHTQVFGPELGKAFKEVTLSTRVVQAQFTAHFGAPERTYLYNFSRGAINVTNLVETSPSRYDGVFSVCGANGGIQLNMDHFFTSRVLFDYFYPGVLPGDALSSPVNDLPGYVTQVAPLIVAAVMANPDPAYEYAAVHQNDLQYNDFSELLNGVVLSLAIHTSGVNSLIADIKGNPFDNMETIYTGSSNDAALNTGVARLSADIHARNYFRTWYEPDGSIDGTPFLALHTSRDPIVREKGNNDKYQALVESTGNGDFFVRRVVDRFGNCTFSNEELASHFSDLVTWVETGVRPSP
jgi:hypothetical protein